jgi:branched-chain amino acid transport system substrate-binding protein
MSLFSAHQGVRSHKPGFIKEGIVRTPRTCCLLVVTLAVLLTVPLTASCQQPIKIGIIYCFSGRLAHYGFAAKQGAEMAMDEINQNGGVLGRKLLGMYGDTELKPPIGVKVAEDLIDDDGVDALMGIVSSGVAKAVAPVVRSKRTPLIITLAMTPDVTGRECNPYTFRISLNGPQNLRGAAALAAQMDVKSWTTLGPDYVFGYQCWEYFEKYLSEVRRDVTFAERNEVRYSPIAENDYTKYINEIKNSRHDGVLVSLYAGNLKDFIRQGTRMGLFDGKKQFLMNLAYSNDVLLSLGLEMPKGLWLSGLYWFQAYSNPENERFVNHYRRKFGVYPDHNAHGAYCGVKAYAAAVKKAGTTEKEAVCRALEGLAIDLPIGTVRIRPEDHQAISPGVWGKTAEYSPKWRSRLLDPLRVFPGEQIARPVADTGCPLPRAAETPDPSVSRQ